MLPENQSVKDWLYRSHTFRCVQLVWSKGCIQEQPGRAAWEMWSTAWQLYTCAQLVHAQSLWSRVYVLLFDSGHACMHAYIIPFLLSSILTNAVSNVSRPHSSIVALTPLTLRTCITLQRSTSSCPQLCWLTVHFWVLLPNCLGPVGYNIWQYYMKEWSQLYVPCTIAIYFWATTCNPFFYLISFPTLVL